MTHDVTITETTNQVVVTDPNGGTAKVVQVGVRGPAGRDAIDEVNLVQDNLYRHIANVESNVDTVSSNVDLVQANLSSLSANSLSDIDTSNATDGDVLVYVAANNQFEAGVVVDDEELDLSSIHNNAVALSANVDVVSANVEALETRVAANDAVVQANLDAFATYANATFVAGSSEADLVQDNVTALEANVDLVQDNVLSVTANLHSTWVTVNTSIDTVSSNVDTVQDNVLAVTGNLHSTWVTVNTAIDTVSSNVTAGDANTYDTWATVNTAIDTVSSNLQTAEANIYDTWATVNTSIDLVQSNVDALVGHGNVTVGVGDLQNEITVLSSDAKDLNISANTQSPDSNIIFASNIVPSSNAVLSLGAPDKQFKDIYISDGTIYIGVNSNISASSISLTNFTVDSDGSIRIPGLNIAADANAVETIELVASDLASNSTIVGITGAVGNLTTSTQANLVEAINEVYNKTGFTSLSVNTSANIGSLQFTGTNVSLNTDGTLTLSNKDILVQGNLIVEGNTTQVDSTITTLEDPIITLGGNSALVADDGKDRGIEFRYYEDSSSKLGFIGYDNSANNFTVLLDATNTDEEFSGSLGDLIVSGFTASTGTIETITANAVTANTLSGNLSATLSNITTANVSALSVGTVNGLTFPIGDGSANQILSTDGAGTLSFIAQNEGVTALGTPTDGSFGDGAYQSFESSTTIPDAVDILNECIENLRINTFVKSVSFTSNVTSGNSPLSVQLTMVPTGNVNQYVISWGDGESNTTTSSTTATHTYNVPLGGAQTVTVTAKNTNGSGEGSEASNTRTDYISLATPSPVSSFTLADDTIDSGSTVSLTNESENADSYEIDWGDGTSNSSLGSSGAGTPGGGAITHTYTNSSGDATYTIVLTAASSSNGQDDSSNDDAYVYSTHSPTFTSNVTSGNNEEATSGLPVLFTNTTSSGPGNNSAYPDTIRYLWTWGDGSTNSVNTGTGSSGDTSQTIAHTFALSSRTVQQTFEVQLQLFNGHSSSPFSSSNTTITVNPDPRSEYVGTFATLSQDLTSSSVRTGYLFTDYNGNKRNVVTYINQSENTDTYEWDFGDSNTVVLSEGEDGTPTGANILHEYTAVGSYTVALTANGTNSLSITDDTDTRSNYITIASNPTPPAGLSAKTITMSAEDVGTSPLLAANFDDNTGGATAVAGDDLPRTVDQSGFITTDDLSSYAASSNTGTLSAVVNGVTDGSKAFTTGNDAGTYTSLVISSDIDANTVDQNGATVSGGSKIYPTGFYRVFKAYIQKSATALSDGVNSLKLSHSEAGDTNVLEFVKETLTSTPSLDLTGASLSENTAGTKRYISGIPYYNSGGIITLSGALAYNWIDQTYRDTSTPFQIDSGTNDESTTGDVIVSQTKRYDQIDGTSTFLSSGIPIKATGINSSSKYALGNININVNGTARAVETIKFRMYNVNGTGSYAELSNTKVQIYSASITGFDEENITVSDDLGATYDDDGKRIVISGASGATPAFNGATNYYTGAAWSGAQTIAGTDEAVTRWGTLKHFSTDLSANYLPVGPDLNTGRTGTQYFRMAFRRSNMANFVVRLTGQISSFNIALPGSGIDDSSGSNGWLDATSQYNGAGQPGSDTGNGGNGSDGCALTGADIIPTGSSISNQTYTLTFGTENASNSTGNQILISIGLASGDSITSLSFEET